jgi:hypothetical protein
VATVTPTDREAARLALRRLAPATEILTAEGRGERGARSILFMIEMLLQVARPLSPELQQWLAPWIAEIESRRQQLALEARQLDARRRERRRSSGC